MNVLVTIPARANSKGVKNKNLRTINGISLIDWAVDAGHTFGPIVLTSNLPEFDKWYGRADERIYYHSRPVELCGSTALAWETWQDAVRAAERALNRSWEYHLYLEPSSPCRTKDDLSDALSALQRGESSYCTVSPAPKPSKLFRLHKNRIEGLPNNLFHIYNNTPRQALRDSLHYQKNGLVYACTDERMKSATTMLDQETYIEIVERPVVNIDTEADLILAEKLLGPSRGPAG